MQFSIVGKKNKYVLNEKDPKLYQIKMVQFRLPCTNAPGTGYVGIHIIFYSVVKRLAYRVHAQCLLVHTTILWEATITN